MTMFCFAGVWLPDVTCRSGAWLVKYLNHISQAKEGRRGRRGPEAPWGAGAGAPAGHGPPGSDEAESRRGGLAKRSRFQMHPA